MAQWSLRVWRISHAAGGWVAGSPRENPVHLHLRPHERLLAGTADGGSQAEDCLLNPQWPLAVPGSPLRPARGTSNLPENDGHPVAAPPVLRSRIPRRHCRPLGDLGGTSGTVAEGAIGATEGWTDRQPPQVSPGPLRGSYLGFQVGRGLIRPQEKKVTAILSAPRPSTKTQVRAFLGLAGYYRCFIPNFSSLASPLTDLTRKGQPEKVPWGPEEEEAFQRVKTALTSEPILRAPDFSCPFLVQTDASNTGLGAVLSQVQYGEEHPVVYISRKLSPAEQRYAVVEKEALAVKWAVLELRYYLLGRKFTLITDHAPLQWMARAKDTNARVTRWFLALQDFHFVVRHRAGTANANADGLSRIWAAFAGLSGFIPLPAPVSPFSRRPGMTLGGGGSVTGVPSAHHRRPGNQRGSPARPRHGLAGRTWGSSRQGLISRRNTHAGETCLQKTPR